MYRLLIKDYSLDGRLVDVLKYEIKNNIEFLSHINEYKKEHPLFNIEIVIKQGLEA